MLRQSVFLCGVRWRRIGRWNGRHGKQGSRSLLHGGDRLGVVVDGGAGGVETVGGGAGGRLDVGGAVWGAT